MKKAFTLLFACLLLSACSAESTYPYGENDSSAETAQNKTADPGGSLSESAVQSTGESTAPLITAERAQEIAFEKAGVTRAEVTRLECELDYDDDRKRREYEIEFNVGSAEYNCEVDAENGEVVRFYKERD